MKVVVIGQGYVGLPVALAAHNAGHQVVGFEIDDRRVAALRAGSSYVGDISDAELAHAVATGFLASSSPEDLADFDIAVVCVPTPLHEGKPDLSAVEGAGELLGPYVQPGCCVILESTTYPGTTDELLIPLLERGSGLQAGADFHVGYSPERIDPGNQTWTLATTPKVVSGIDAASLEIVDGFYAQFVHTTVRVGSTREAEMVKLLENTFRHVNIALLNELAVVSNALDIDLWNVIDAASTKPFGFMRFTHGPGVGGHCLPVDPSYLSWAVSEKLGRDFRFVELANDINHSMPSYVIERARHMLSDHGLALAGSRVLLLGLAYKRNTSDWRESPTVAVLDGLREAGATVAVCDPYVPSASIAASVLTTVAFDDAALSDADLVIVLVDHDQFDPAAIAAHASLVLDTKGLMRGVAFSGELL